MPPLVGFLKARGTRSDAGPTHRSGRDDRRSGWLLTSCPMGKDLVSMRGSLAAMMSDHLSASHGVETIKKDSRSRHRAKSTGLPNHRTDDMDYLDLIHAWICTASLTFAFVLAFVIWFLRRRRRRPRPLPTSLDAGLRHSRLRRIDTPACLSSTATIGSTTPVVASADLSSRSISGAGARARSLCRPPTGPKISAWA